MTPTNTRLTLSNFQQKYKKNLEEKVLEEALVYLKLRQHGCPKTRALIFAKKKQKGVDGTAVKDGPAGFRKLKPEKPLGTLNSGWLKGQKLKYTGLRGFSEEIKRNVSKEKKSITSYNQISRKDMEVLRKTRKADKQGFLRVGQNKILMQQIGNVKDQFLKDRQKRNLFLSYGGFRLNQLTREYFERVDEIDPDNLILKLAAFDQPINDERMQLQMDWQVAKGRSLSSYQVDGQQKRKTLMNFRKSLSNLDFQKKQKNDKFNFALQKSNQNIWRNTFHGKSFSKEKKQFIQKDFAQFYNNVQKVLCNKNTFVNKSKQIPPIAKISKE